MPVPERVIELVERFKENEAIYRSPSYKEAHIRQDFLDPFFECLGWDLRNRSGSPEVYREVIFEDSIKVRGSTKAPDYCFRIGGNRKFFVEAKKPSVNLDKNISAAYQVRRYGWSAKLSISILTDFEELAIYDCRIMPNKTDEASKARLKYLTYEQYADCWEDIYDLFSKEAVLAGSLEKYEKESKKKKGADTVDSAFLREIEKWREQLAVELSQKNTELTQRQLNFAVQITINRLIFLRISEDRGIEPYEELRSITKTSGVYKSLCGLFRRADDRYNSGLFHFKDEKGREDSDEFTLRLIIGDDTLTQIIRHLYYPDSPYEFSVLPVEVLGQVYEQFLGKIICLTDEHEAIVEDKPEVKKAGGVYYTPTNIVDYIVKVSVGKLLKNKTPLQAKNLKILDPSCGSGSFLIGIYQYLLDWYLKKYAENPDGRGHKNKIYKAENGQYRLTSDERKQILLKNIYGVDVDLQAVETTKLSLLLKVLEGESEETLARQMTLFQKRALPDLEENIRCGNSIISPDYYQSVQINMLDEDEIYRINTFDWKEEFSEILGAGGFDVVIGNPPYGDYFTKEEKTYLLDKYKLSFSGTFDIYIFFFDMAMRVLKDKGRLCFITSHSFLSYSQFAAIRKLLISKNDIELVMQVKDVFESAIVDNAIISLAKSKKQGKSFSGGIVNEGNDTLSSKKLSQFPASNLSADSFFIRDSRGFDIQRIIEESERLDSYVKITQGITTGGNLCFIGGEGKFSREGISKMLLKKVLKGKNLDRYKIEFDQEYILYSIKTLPEEYQSQISTYLLPHKQKLSKKRETQNGKLPWYCLHWPRSERDFNEEKILIRQTASKIIAALDDDFYYPLDTIHTLNLIHYDENSSKLIKYILGILNSTLYEYLYLWKLDEVGKVYPQIKKINIAWLPIKKIDFNVTSEKAAFSQMSSLVDSIADSNKRLSYAKTKQERDVIKLKVKVVDNQINQLVYSIYSITSEEISVIESSI